MKGSKQGRSLIVILLILIPAMYFGLPAPPKVKSAKSATDATMMELADEPQQNPAVAQKIKEQKAARRAQQQKAAPPPIQVPPQAAGIVSPSDYAMMADRYGKSDPFAPFFDVKEFKEAAMELPDLEPLPPMVLNNPPNMKLSAVVFNKGVGMAIVNGELLYKGDSLQGFQVKELTVDKVVMVNDLNDKIVLRLKQEGLGDFGLMDGSLNNIEELPVLPGNEANTGNLIPSRGNYPPAIPAPKVPSPPPAANKDAKKQPDKKSKAMKAIMDDNTLIDVNEILNSKENKPR